MTGALLYAGISLAVIAALAWMFGLVFPSPAEQRAIWLSAAVAFVVQNAGFAIARLMSPRWTVAGWGIGAVLCLVTVVIVGLVASAQALPLPATLVSLATFLFLTELLEPLLLSAS